MLPRILCTEDHPDTLELINFVLTNAGFNVTCAAGALETLKLAEGEHFDLYIIDNRLPGVSGYDLCTRLREFDARTPILFYSGAGFEDDKARAREAGAQGLSRQAGRCGGPHC